MEVAVVSTVAAEADTAKSSRGQLGPGFYADVGAHATPAVSHISKPTAAGEGMYIRGIPDKTYATCVVAVVNCGSGDGGPPAGRL